MELQERSARRAAQNCGLELDDRVMEPPETIAER